MKSRNLSFLEPSGPVQACTGIALTLTLPSFFGLSCTTVRIINDNKWERIRKEVIVPEFVVASRDLRGRAEKTA
jgi:hypothetical protein